LQRPVLPIEHHERPVVHDLAKKTADELGFELPKM
jgi:hypothetical protein